MRGIIGPKGMPDAVKTKIATAVQKVLQTEELTSYIKESSLVSAYQGPEDFTAFAKAQDELTKSWMKKLSLTR
jgi:tripartite-type tricarboxylate transporter receptor subunit TctC